MGGGLSLYLGIAIVMVCELVELAADITADVACRVRGAARKKATVVVSE